MQLILVISKGEEMKSKFPFEKSFFFFFSPVHFPYSVFPYRNFLVQESWKIFVALIV